MVLHPNNQDFYQLDSPFNYKNLLNFLSSNITIYLYLYHDNYQNGAPSNKSNINKHRTKHRIHVNRFLFSCQFQYPHHSLNIRLNSTLIYTYPMLAFFQLFFLLHLCDSWDNKYYQRDHDSNQIMTACSQVFKFFWIQNQRINCTYLILFVKQ